MLINKKLVVYLIFTTSIFLGFLFQENSSGGARYDHDYFSETIKNFSLGLKVGFDQFVRGDGGLINGSIIHSPGFYMLIGLLLRIFDNIVFIKLIYLVLCSFFPFIFYSIIKTKYNIKNDYIFYFSLIVFFSPYFRSSAIWLLGDNLGLFFFSLSILFYLKSKVEKKLLNFYLCFIFLILCCYIRYYYCVFSIYFLYYIYKNLDLKTFLYLILISLFLSIPAFYYFFIIISNYNFLGTLFSFGSINFYSNILIILSIILFYLIPIIFFDIKFSFFSYYKKNYQNILLFFLPIIFVYILDKFSLVNLIEFSYRGGGIFFKISKILNFEIELFISLLAFISLIILDYLFKENRIRNYFLLITLICCFPLVTIYQKYVDPLIYLMIFGLINSNYLKEMMMKGSIKILFIYGYFSSFYILTLIYYNSQGV